MAANAGVVSHLGADDAHTARLSTILALGLAYVGCLVMGSLVFVLKNQIGVFGSL